MKRRDVLKAGVAAGAGLLRMPDSGRAAQADGGGDELNVALIGVGLQGRALINAALKMESVRFRAVCDIWDYSRRYGTYYLSNYGHQVNAYADYREMLDKEHGLHAVIVASPDVAHAEQVNACLEAGLAVYCEAMLSNTLEGARSMLRKMQQTGKLLQVGYQRRSNPRYLHVYDKLLQEAKLTGRIAQANAQWVIALSDERGWPKKHVIPAPLLQQYGYGDMREFRNWRWFKKYSGGLFGNLGGHQLDVLNWFLGATPRSVAAVGSEDHDQARQWHKNVMAIYQYDLPEGPLQAFCQMLTSTRGDGSGAHEQFFGRQGSLRISQNPKWTAIYRDPDAPEWDEWVRLDYLRSSEQQRASRSEREAADAAETGEVEAFQLPVVLDQPPQYHHLQNFFEAVRGTAQLNAPADKLYPSEVVALKTVEAVAARKTLEFTADDFAV